MFAQVQSIEKKVFEDSQESLSRVLTLFLQALIEIFESFLFTSYPLGKTI